MSRCPVLAGLLLLATSVSAGPPLPPELPWDGESRSLIASPDDEWITPTEASAFSRTPTYDETVAWLRRLVEATDKLQMVSLGTSPEGREIWMVVASAEGVATPGALRENGRPTLLAQSCIHAGEVGGKDAGMMLLRDLTVRGERSSLLADANFLFVPIFSVDGHERRSPYGRINQRGPDETGWRTTSRNLNLNRDYSKLDTPEMRAMVLALRKWDPDLYLDLHVTDGADYRHDVTYGWNGSHALSPAIATWLDERYEPALAEDLRRMGHIPGPLVFFADTRDREKGVHGWTASPRFSNGYGDARHLPTVVVEVHSLKPFEQRVLGNYVLMESSLRTLGRDGAKLRKAIARDESARPREVVLTWKVPEDNKGTLELLGVESRLKMSAVTGDLWVEWTGRPFEAEVPHLVPNEPVVRVSRATAYYVPPAWSEVIERLELHGIRLERLEQPTTREVEMYRIREPKLDSQPYEGHVRVSAKVGVEKRSETLPPGTARVPTDQPLGNLATLLLEPQSPDSFFQWGFFHEMLNRTEYVESYVMEPLAQQMLDEDPELKAAFENKLATDEGFKKNPRARLMWFYRRTPYYDERHLLYPVAREP